MVLSSTQLKPYDSLARLRPFRTQYTCGRQRARVSRRRRVPPVQQDTVMSPFIYTLAYSY